MILLVDSLNLFLRCYAAIPTLAIDQTGSAPGGVLGFIRTLRKIMTFHATHTIFAAWDAPGGSRKRKNLYKDYKGKKKHPLNNCRMEAADQMVMLKDYLEVLGVHQKELKGFEADDLIAQLCRELKNEEKIIVSADKDFMQLVNENTKFYNLQTKKLFGIPETIKYFDCLPENICFLRAVIGDPSDNIKGVRGVGKKLISQAIPQLKTEKLTADKMLEYALTNRTIPFKQNKKRQEPMQYYAGKKLIDSKEVFLRNIELMDLVNYKLDKRLENAIKEELNREIKPDAGEFRMRYLKDEFNVIEMSRIWAIFQNMAERKRESKETNITKE